MRKLGMALTLAMIFTAFAAGTIRCGEEAAKPLGVKSGGKPKEEAKVDAVTSASPDAVTGASPDATTGATKTAAKADLDGEIEDYDPFAE